MRELVLGLVLGLAGSCAEAAGHYCDDFPEAEREECLRVRIRGDDDCTRIADGSERLICWDQQRAREDCASKYSRTEGQTEEECLAALEASSASVPEPPVVAPKFPAWYVETDRSAFTDEPRVIVTSMSSNPAQCASGRPTYPQLVFRCEENVTEMFMTHGCYTPTITVDTWPVDIRIDDRPMQTLQMGGSSSNEALGLWNYRGARDFAEQLYGAETLLVRFHDYSGNQAALTFPVHDLMEALQPLRDACGWPP